ncbi:MAG: glycosyltransferase family 2 protein [Clostridiales bacterium]|nr:glycosyltransferase family 2 protein [Clostridiales bacterium]
MLISVVIPVYGCKKAIPELHRRLSESLSSISDKYEIIYSNDACPQDSWSEISRICDEDKHAVGIEMARNFGQMKAILAGLDHSSGKYIVVMDCDLQDRPEEIPKLYAKIREGNDIVFARRANRKDSAMKVFVSNMFYKLYEYASDTDYDGTISNFSMVRRRVIDYYCSMREQSRSYVIYLKWLGFRQAYVDVEHNERFEGKSSYNFKKRMNMAIDILTSQSDKILRLTVKLGFAITLLSLLAVIFLVVQYFTIQVAPGWTSTIAVSCLICGLLLMSNGIVGTYVGNIFMQTKGRPLYVIRQIKNGPESEDEESSDEDEGEEE